MITPGLARLIGQQCFKPGKTWHVIDVNFIPATVIALENALHSEARGRIRPDGGAGVTAIGFVEVPGFCTRALRLA
jgi:hypothetical protein